MANYFEKPNIGNQSTNQVGRPENVDGMAVFRNLMEKSVAAREISRAEKDGKTFVKKLGDNGEIYELTYDGADVIEIIEKDERDNTINFFGSSDKHPENDYSRMKNAKNESLKKFIDRIFN